MSTRLARYMTEEQFADTVIQLAKLHGWHCAHFRPARTAKGWRTLMQGHPGFPDLVLARGGTVIFAELKSENGRLRKDQREWASAIGNVELWRPSMMDSIKETLR